MPVFYLILACLLIIAYGLTNVILAGQKFKRYEHYLELRGKWKEGSK